MVTEIELFYQSLEILDELSERGAEMSQGQMKNKLLVDPIKWSL